MSDLVQSHEARAATRLNDVTFGVPAAYIWAEPLERRDVVVYALTPVIPRVVLVCATQVVDAGQLLPTSVSPFAHGVVSR